MIRTLITIALTALALNAFAAVDANKASQAELETVKGIGPGLSSKILEARKSNAFKDWTDLVDRVSGIGAGNAARFSQAGLTVADRTYVASASDASKPVDKAAKAAKADTAGSKSSRKAAEVQPK